MNKKYLTISFILFFMVSQLAFGQVLKLLSYEKNPVPITQQIRTDTTNNPGILATRIYELENGGTYLCTEILTLLRNKTLRLRAPEGVKPIIYLFPTGTGANPTNPPGNFVVLNGGNVELTNIAIAGIFEPDPTSINNMQGGLINTTGVGSRIIVDKCILSNVNGNQIRTGSGAKIVKVTNTIISNMGSLTTSNFGAGKAVDLREVSCDSLILVNNTFVNSQDRTVRHLNLAAGNTVTGILGYCYIDHNTFVNGMGFHGVLSLGNVGKRVQITNNLFVDAFALGQDSLDVTRSVEFNNTGEKYANGNNKMPWIFKAPNDTTVWVVRKNFYSISNSGQNFFTANPRHSQGAIITDHIKGKLGSGAATAFTKLNNFTMTNIPKLMINLMNYYISPTGGNYTKDKPNYNYLTNDMDRKAIIYYRDTMNCRYPTTSPAYTGADNGLPAGATGWWGIVLGVEKTNDQIPTDYSLNQNYPNPFNPVTNITYSIPKSSLVKLEVFDILGKLVTTLVNQTQAAGQYKVDFNGNKLSSGVYIYRLSTPSQIISKKMLLMK